MATPKHQGKGCLTMFLLWGFIIFIAMLQHGDSNTFYDNFPAFTLLIIFIVIGIIIEKYISKNAKDTPIPSKINEIEKRQGEEGLKYISYLNNVTYIGGHDSYMNKRDGNIGLKKDEIVFYSDKIKTIDNWQTTVKSVKFTIKLDKIEKITYELSENITMGRFLTVGLAAFVFKKKTYYLIIDYKSNAGVLNQVVFETGSKKNQLFLNELNIKRNKFIELNTKENKHTDEKVNKNITGKIRELAKLRDDGILSEEEFMESKRKLLGHI